MYLRHFAFTRWPFAANLESDQLFASASRQEAEARLQHLLHLRGIGLLTGEVGCGKTTVCRAVTASLHPGLFRVLYVSLTTGNVMDMYKSIAWELGLPAERSRATAYRAIRSEITRQVQEARLLPVLVVDEAQFLRTEVLTDLRLLTNYTMDSEHRLCLLLVGLTELRRRLSMAVHVAQPAPGRAPSSRRPPHSMPTSPTACAWPAAKGARRRGLVPCRAATADQHRRPVLANSHRRAPAARPRRTAPLTAATGDCRPLPRPGGTPRRGARTLCTGDTPHRSLQLKVTMLRVLILAGRRPAGDSTSLRSDHDAHCSHYFT